MNDIYLATFPPKLSSIVFKTKNNKTRYYILFEFEFKFELLSTIGAACWTWPAALSSSACSSNASQFQWCFLLLSLQHFKHCSPHLWFFWGVIDNEMSCVLSLLLLLLICNNIDSVVAIETKKSCLDFYELLVQTYDRAANTCYAGATIGEHERLLDESKLVRCLFRNHCITRLVGITDDAIKLSPPPLFELDNIEPYLAFWINSTYCNGQTNNQFFQA